MKFITLTSKANEPIRVNFDLVIKYYQNFNLDTNYKVTFIETIKVSNFSFIVKETPEEIDNLLRSIGATSQIL